ncbi:unnamed protein product [marine sediment metagenome]|uniref:Uncharacterized protein n=1 Tax=marine sediment metagenome TaxID=412755 RepID=X1HTM9_9ZZZZ
MSWKERMKEWGGGDLAFLSEDGEMINFVVVGEPELLTGKFKGKDTEKIGCPVVTEDGFALLVAGKRLARKIAKYEEQFQVQAFTAIRHGEADDPNTKYELKTITNVELVKKLFAIAGTDFRPDMIPVAVSDAEAVMQG